MSQNTDTKHKAKSLDDNNCNKFHIRFNISIYIYIYIYIYIFENQHFYILIEG